jgi:transposase
VRRGAYSEARILASIASSARTEAAGADQKFVVFGALDYASGRIVHQRSRSDQKEAASFLAFVAFVAFVAFLEQLAQTLPADEPLVVVLDNAGYHTSGELRAWWQQLQHADRFQPCWLPAYTPQLNRIERLWRHMKDKLACHRWWNDVNRLKQATDTLLAGLELHFHPTDGAAFRPVHNFCKSA